MMLIVLLHTVFDEVELRGVYVICEIATPVFFSYHLICYFSIGIYRGIVTVENLYQE